MNKQLLIKFIKSEIFNYTEIYDQNFYNKSNDSILEYWENEFFWWKKEALEDILNFLKRNF